MAYMLEFLLSQLSDGNYAVLKDILAQHNINIWDVPIFNAKCYIRLLQELGFNFQTILLDAINKNREDIVHLALQANVDIDQTYDWGWTAVSTAVKNNNISMTELLLDYGANPTSQCHYRTSVLHVAVRRNQLEMATFLLDYGVDVDAVDYMGYTALFFVTTIDMARLLLDCGANIHHTNCIGNTAAYKVICHTDIVELFLDHGVDINMQRPGDKYTLLHTTMGLSRSCTRTIKLLLDRGANINLQNECGDTVLHMACKYAHECIPQLLDYSANINLQNKDGDTALHLVCKHANIWPTYSEEDIDIMLSYHYITYLLLECGADVHLQNKDGDTVLHLACGNKCIDVIRLLLDHGADINLQNERGDTALHQACRYVYECIPLLIDRGADINLQNAHREPALYNINLQNEHGDTPLHLACETNHINAICILLDHGANVNLQNEHGDTPLHLACKYAYKCIPQLLDHGANANLRNKNGKNALEVAIDKYNIITAKLLVDVTDNADSYRSIIYDMEHKCPRCSCDHTDTTRAIAEAKCPICMCEYEDAYATECNHLFCRVCIDFWYKKHPSCPICRKPIHSIKN